MSKPQIGISTAVQDHKYNVSRHYARWIINTGGIPVLLPYADESIELAEELDGLLLTGGADVGPEFYGQEPQKGLGIVDRSMDIYEKGLVEIFTRKHKPILGICRGAQILNVSLNGSLYQDITHSSNILQKLLSHDKNDPISHTITLNEHTFLYDVFSKKSFKVTSTHHQSIHELGEGFVIAATAPDKIIEAICRTVPNWAVGVQWHPEMMDDHCQESHALFSAFLKACMDRAMEEQML